MHSPANVIEAATAGRFLFPCAATAWIPGNLVGPVNNAGNTGLQNQSVGSVSGTSLSIGRAAPAADEIGVSLTQVIVQIESTIMGGGAQAAVPEVPAEPCRKAGSRERRAGSKERRAGRRPNLPAPNSLLPAPCSLL